MQANDACERNPERWTKTMMTFDQIADATLGQLTDELAAAGWDSCETSIDAARESVTRLVTESMPVEKLMASLDDAGFEKVQDWNKGETSWRLWDDLRICIQGEEVEVITEAA